MQLNLTTDYAFRLLLCLGSANGTLSGSAIADTMKIPPNYLLKISSKLRRAGLIGSMAGTQGGYYLTKSLSEITLLEIIDIMEPSYKWNRCLEDDSFCSREATRSCPIRKFYVRLQTELETKWLSKSLAEIVELAEDEETNECQRGKMIIRGVNTDEKPDKAKEDSDSVCCCSYNRGSGNWNVPPLRRKGCIG